MYRSLVRKEFVETGAVAAVALVVYAGLLIFEIYDFRYRAWRPAPLDIQVMAFFAVISAGFAAVLGLVQTVSESVQGTWGYLLHLPLGRRRIVLTKLAWGLFLYTVCSLMLVLACALLAYSRQTVDYPIWEWIVVPILRCLVAGLVVYLGAFLSGLRPARWYGSRLFPLAGCGCVWWASLFVSSGWGFFAAVLILSALLIGSILHVADHRDYT